MKRSRGFTGKRGGGKHKGVTTNWKSIIKNPSRQNPDAKIGVLNSMINVSCKGKLYGEQFLWCWVVLEIVKDAVACVQLQEKLDKRKYSKGKNVLETNECYDMIVRQTSYFKTLCELAGLSSSQIRGIVLNG